MKKPSLAVLTAALATSLMAQPPAPPKTSLKVGDMAPDFELPSTQGGKVKLSSFRGKEECRSRLLPGGCTKEMSAFQANFTKFDGIDTMVFGISTGNTPSQIEFGKKLGRFLFRHVERFRHPPHRGSLRDADA